MHLAEQICGIFAYDDPEPNLKVGQERKSAQSFHVHAEQWLHGPLRFYDSYSYASLYTVLQSS